MYIKNETLLKKMGDEAKDDLLDRLYDTVACLVPCQCCCEMAITKPTPRNLNDFRAVEFRAICPECYTSADFVLDATFFAD